CVGARGERPESVAAVEDGRAGDGLAVGADDPAGDVSAGADHRDRAEVPGLAGLALHLGRLGLAVARGLDHDLVVVARPAAAEVEPARVVERLRLEGAAKAHGPAELLALVAAIPPDDRLGPRQPLA